MEKMRYLLDWRPRQNKNGTVDLLRSPHVPPQVSPTSQTNSTLESSWALASTSQTQTAFWQSTTKTWMDYLSSDRRPEERIMYDHTFRYQEEYLLSLVSSLRWNKPYMSRRYTIRSQVGQDLVTWPTCLETNGVFETTVSHLGKDEAGVSVSILVSRDHYIVAVPENDPGTSFG